jgi:FtsP/CotA-like multicopper oxidase with cupredoxin domain
MTLRLSFFSAALLFVLSTTLKAQLGPQTFLPPPPLSETQKPGALHMHAMAAVLSTPSGSVCDPAAEVTHTGNIVTVTLGVEEHKNTIYNPGNPATNYRDTVSLRSYGGCLTGPLIDTKPGTTLRVNLTNDLSKDDPSCPHGLDPVGQPGCFNTINMHFHGLHVSPSGNSDNVLLNITPRTQFNYEVNIPEDHPSGTFWYHAHRHGSTAMQVASGASGVLIIRGNRPYTPATPNTPAIPGDIDTILKDTNGPFKEQLFLFQQIPYACFDDNATSSAPDQKTLTHGSAPWARSASSKISTNNSPRPPYGISVVATPASTASCNPGSQASRPAKFNAGASFTAASMTRSTSRSCP